MWEGNFLEVWIVWRVSCVRTSQGALRKYMKSARLGGEMAPYQMGKMVRGWAGCWEIFPSLMAWWQTPGLQVPPQIRFSQKLPVQALPMNQAGSWHPHSQRISGTPQGCSVPQPQPVGVSPGNKPERGGGGAHRV